MGPRWAESGARKAQRGQESPWAVGIRLGHLVPHPAAVFLKPPACPEVNG